MENETPPPASPLPTIADLVRVLGTLDDLDRGMPGLNEPDGASQTQ
jgi:hypothetical protein